MPVSVAGDGATDRSSGTPGGAPGAGPGARLRRLRQTARRLYHEVPYLRGIIDELTRVELLDRSLALGAQALLALIPLLIVVAVFMPADLGSLLTAQVRDALGVDSEVMLPVQQAAARAGYPSEVGWIGLVVALASASSFARALARMYCRVWDLPPSRGLGALQRSVLWIVGWVMALQILTVVLRTFADAPLTRVVHLSLQLCFNVLLWWWTAHFLLRGRVSWRALLPLATISAVLIVVLGMASNVLMPRYARTNLEQFGPLGVVFAIATWLVVFGGVLVLAAVVGRHLPGLGKLTQTPAQATRDG